MDKIVEELKSNVDGECYLFIYRSVHIFDDEGKITLEIFTCDVTLDDRKIKK